ncbi:multiheme c-type cytochrome [Silanimonas sp.]|uniref:multiheme c-type cytochrome n=1 Tax=Silanimonas sp. TaxID=1929290 RepID=UPI0022BDFC72|nr:multiheme c-type cytochrome [Silanimonas sp.]MCZ8115038.1 multiheme c-type cytochrome [Silanimonas sp.]
MIPRDALLILLLAMAPVLPAFAASGASATPVAWTPSDDAIRAENALRQPMPDRASGTSLGTVTCASSTCHGSVLAWDDVVLHNEYTTWARLDRHTRAYATLLTPASVSIARKLGLSTPAHEAPECLACHAYAPPAEQRGERFVLSDGISCEGCHGPAERWVASHTSSDASHAKNLANGLYPTSDPVGQARLCTSCHVGDGDRWVTHRIMGAGHPRLGFEVGTFAALQPPHYAIDADWRQRKGDFSAGRVWALGQLFGAKAMLETLAHPTRGRDGLFPELSAFDCHACHKPMSANRWSPRLGIGPGRVRVNDGHLLMLRAITEAVVPDQAAAFRNEVRGVHAAVSAGQGDPQAALRRLVARLDALVPVLRAQAFDAAQMRAVLQRLIAIGRSGEYSDYAGAEQAYMAIAPLLEQLAADGQLADAAALRPLLARARETLAGEDTYRAERFRAALDALAGAVRAPAGTEG